MPLGHATGAVAHGLSRGKGGVNDGTEAEAAELFDIFEDNNNVYGLVGSSDSVHYLGISLSLCPCRGVSWRGCMCVMICVSASIPSSLCVSLCSSASVCG